jgi:hypothetical protein
MKYLDLHLIHKAPEGAFFIGFQPLIKSLRRENFLICRIKIRKRISIATFVA